MLYVLVKKKELKIQSKYCHHHHQSHTAQNNNFPFLSCQLFYDFLYSFTSISVFLFLMLAWFFEVSWIVALKIISGGKEPQTHDMFKCKLNETLALIIKRSETIVTEDQTQQPLQLPVPDFLL